MANEGTTPTQDVGGSRGSRRRSGDDLAKHPILQTVLFLCVAAVAFVLLGHRQGSSDLVNGNEWLIWKATAAAGQAVAVSLLVNGVVRLAAAYSRADRTVFLFSIGAALVLVIGVLIGVESMINSDRDWSIPAMEVRLEWVVRIGTICAVPWVSAVWIAYSRVEGAVTTADLLEAWDFLLGISQAFALFVVVSVLPTGALLNLWLAQATTDDQLKERREVFDAEHVALYGAMYGVIVVAIVLPLLVAWRAKAKAHVDRLHTPPEDDAVTSSWYEDRLAHETLLGLDVALIRNPLTALAVLTPLVTSVIATYLPGVGDKT